MLSSTLIDSASLLNFSQEKITMKMTITTYQIQPHTLTIYCSIHKSTCIDIHLFSNILAQFNGYKRLYSARQQRTYSCGNYTITFRAWQVDMG